MTKYIFSFIMILSFSANADICSNLTDDIPVLAGGRVKPYFVLAKESIKFLTGKSKYNNESPSLTFCRLALQKKAQININFPILVEHIKTKSLLGLDPKTMTMGVNELISSKDLIRSEIFKLKENNSFKKDLNKLWTRIATFEKIKDGMALTFYTGDKSETNPLGWIPAHTYNTSSDTEYIKIVKDSKVNYIKDNGDNYLLELTYVKSHIFGYALAISLIGIFLTVLFKNMKYGVMLSALTLIAQITGMVWRILISGRAPITNMYETVLFSGTGALVMALIILYFKREKIYLLAGLGYNILCLFMMMFANNMLNSSISPLVPVLRDNFWLSTHVTTIMLSYAALALSWLVANITLFKMKLKKLTKKDYRYHQSLIYTCIKVGIVLLGTGIILGGVWADYSWGRFWGWDPKETWSLIVLLFYIIIVHGKYSSWITTHRFVMLSAAGFMTVMMAWFGVNYILAAGLHSYGFSEGGAIFLFSFFAIQIIFLIYCSFNNKFQENNA